MPEEITPPQPVIQPASGAVTHKAKWLIPGVIVVVIVLLFLLHSAKVIIVLDHDTFLPVADASIKISTFEFFSGCVADTNYQTSSLGTASLTGMQRPSVCSVHVEKDGYHPNGENASVAINWPPWIDIITIQKIKNPQPLVVKGITFQQGDKADFLSVLGAQDVSQLKAIPLEISGPANIDFDFPAISNEATQPNVIGRAVMRIRFSGDGGVQQLPGGKGTGNGTYRQYALENLIQAPTTGYAKELSLESGGQYVARLRDGKHYMKFYISGLEYNGQHYAQAIFFIQPNESPLLESIDSDHVLFGIGKQAGTPTPLPAGPISFSIDAPKDGSIYFYDEDVTFSGTAPVDSVVHISMPENQSTATVKPDKNGKWMTFINDGYTAGSGNETSWSYCATGCPSAEAVTTRNVTISNGDKSYTIHYSINKKRTGTRTVNLGNFSLDIPANIIAQRTFNDKSGKYLRIAFCEAYTCGQKPALFSIDEIWLGDDSDLLTAARKWSAWDHSQYETFSLGKLTGYKIPENNPPSSANALYLGYKNVLVGIGTVATQPYPSSLFIKILDSIQPLSP